jgi:hypothetical protein
MTPKKPKPPYGQACNGCGLCCPRSICRTSRSVADKLAATQAWQARFEKGLKLPDLTADQHALLIGQKRSAAAAVTMYEKALEHERANPPPTDLAMLRLLNMPAPPTHW